MRCRQFYALRVDGVKFTQFRKLQNETFIYLVENVFLNAINDVFRKFNFINSAYLIDDEISFFINCGDFKNEEESRLQKIISKVTSYISVKFNEYLRIYEKGLCISLNVGNYFFDGRIIEIQKYPNILKNV